VEAVRVLCFARKRASRKGEGVYDSEVLGSKVKKSRCRTKPVPVLKLTLTGRVTKSSEVFSSKRQNEILLIGFSFINGVLPRGVFWRARSVEFWWHSIEQSVGCDQNIIDVYRPTHPLLPVSHPSY
jgi:hypothetical protein